MMFIPIAPRTSSPARVAALGLGLLCALAAAPAAEAAPIVPEAARAAKHHPANFLDTIEGWFKKQQSYVTSEVTQDKPVFGFASGRPQPQPQPQPQPAGGLGLAPATPPGRAQGPDLTPGDGLLPQTPRILALEKRRDLNPTRFDALHPRLGPLLAEDERLRGAMPGVTLASFHAYPAGRPAGGIARVPAAETIVATPEPGAATIALALIGAVALARRVRPRRPA